MVGLLSMVAQLQVRPGHKEMNMQTQNTPWDDGTALFRLPRSSIPKV